MVKPFSYVGTKVSNVAKNNKKAVSGLGLTTLAGVAGLGYYFKDALAQAAQASMNYAQPFTVAALENRTDIAKAAGVALAGITALDGIRYAYNSYKDAHTAAATMPVTHDLAIEEVKEEKITPAKEELMKINDLMQDDLEYLLDLQSDERVLSKILSLKVDESLFTQAQMAGIEGLKQDWNRAYNYALFTINGSSRKDKAIEELRSIISEFSDTISRC